MSDMTKYKARPFLKCRNFHGGHLLSYFDFINIFNSVVKHIAINGGGLGFDSRASQIGRRVANGSPPLRCFFGTALPRG